MHIKSLTTPSDLQDEAFVDAIVVRRLLDRSLVRLISVYNVAAKRTLLRHKAR